MYSAKVVEFGQNGCIREGGCIRKKVVVFGGKNKGDYIRQKWLNSDKVVVFGHQCCIRARVVVFEQSGCILANMVVFGQK